MLRAIGGGLDADEALRGDVVLAEDQLFAHLPAIMGMARREVIWVVASME